MVGIQGDFPLYTIDIPVWNGPFGPTMADRCRLGPHYLLIIADYCPWESGALKGQVITHFKDGCSIFFLNRPDIR